MPKNQDLLNRHQNVVCFKKKNVQDLQRQLKFFNQKQGNRIILPKVPTNCQSQKIIDKLITALQEDNKQKNEALLKNNQETTDEKNNLNSSLFSPQKKYINFKGKRQNQTIFSEQKGKKGRICKNWEKDKQIIHSLRMRSKKFTQNNEKSQTQKSQREKYQNKNDEINKFSIKFSHFHEFSKILQKHSESKQKKLVEVVAFSPKKQHMRLQTISGIQDGLVSTKTKFKMKGLNSSLDFVQSRNSEREKKQKKSCNQQMNKKLKRRVSQFGQYVVIFERNYEQRLRRKNFEEGKKLSKKLKNLTVEQKQCQQFTPWEQGGQSNQLSQLTYFN